MSDPDYVVIRASLDLPEGWMPADMEGRWYDRRDIPIPAREPDPRGFRASGGSVTTAVAEPSGRFEVRADGAVAEVWEVRPGHK